jgi:hypothetical protein
MLFGKFNMLIKNGINQNITNDKIIIKINNNLSLLTSVKKKN